MNKRRFLTMGAVGTGALVQTHAATPNAPKGTGLLTVSGAIGRSNRGALDPALDQLLVKHKAAFDRAWEFDAAMLARLSSLSIQPTLEYDAKVHKLADPALSAVVEAAGVSPGTSVNLLLRAVDGYTLSISLADARAYRMIVATTLDGVPMALGGLGPLWVVYDADRLAAFKDKPLKERFGLCPWGLYASDVQPL